MQCFKIMKQFFYFLHLTHSVTGYTTLELNGTEEEIHTVDKSFMLSNIFSLSLLTDFIYCGI